MFSFGATTGAFCMFFDFLSMCVFVQPQTQFVEPQILVLVSEGPGPLFGPKKGERKTCFCGGTGPPRGFAGFLKRGVVSTLPRSPLGVPIYLQSLPGQGFTRISPKPEMPGGPLGFCRGCLLPFKDCLFCHPQPCLPFGLWWVAIYPLGLMIFSKSSTWLGARHARRAWHARHA